MKLSVALIAKNEANSIRRCLDSVKGADEIIVVDTGSEDNTVEIAKEYTDKVFTDYKWNDNFAEARNHANSKCTGDWILVIDSDNRLLEGIDKVREEIEKAETNGFKTISLRIVLEDGNRFSHYLPYLYKNDPEIFWNGAVHNHLTADDKNFSELTLSCWHSDSHYKDPDRSFRILKKEVASKPELVREKFYLAREYYNRGDFITAVWFYSEYLKKAYWGPEMADANLMMARCYWFLQKGDLARAFCMAALTIDANFKEAALFMAEMSGPKNKERWLLFSETANDQDTLFQRFPKEWKSGQYDEQFTNDSDMSRYKVIHEKIGELVGEHTVLDIGCGVGELSKYIKNYKGFDFSPVAVAKTKEKGAEAWVGSAYDKENFKEADYYVSTEVFEHLDDLKLLENVPSGQRLIFSIPSFSDPSHIRTYTEQSARRRYKDILDITNITRFNWQGEWVLGGAETLSYILLVEATKK